MKNNDKILDIVNQYYTQKINEHGVTPKGVDWNSAESQHLRFNQLCGILEGRTDFSLLDFGCGYGAMLDYLDKKYDDFLYTGFDISKAMISSAQQHAADKDHATWITQLVPDRTYDYIIASGIFNVRQDITNKEWEQYITDTLTVINNRSNKGFSFNMLTSYSDKEFMRDYLYYADPSFYFDFCKRNFSKYVALLHDYPLYEFTILVKKN